MLEINTHINTAEDLLKFLQQIPPPMLSQLPVSMIVNDAHAYESVDVEAYYVQETDHNWEAGLRFYNNPDS